MGRVANTWGIAALLLLVACAETEPPPELEAAVSIDAAPVPVEPVEVERELTQRELDAREIRLLAERKPFPASGAELREWLIGDLVIRIESGPPPGEEGWSTSLTQSQSRHEFGRSHALARAWFASFARRDPQRLSTLYTRTFEGVDAGARRRLLAFLQPSRRSIVKSTNLVPMARELSVPGATFHALESGLTEREFLLLDRPRLFISDIAPSDEFIESALAALAERPDGAEILVLWDEIRRPKRPVVLHDVSNSTERLDRLAADEAALWEAEGRGPTRDEIDEWLRVEPFHELRNVTAEWLDDAIAGEDAVAQRRAMLVMFLNPTRLAGREAWVQSVATTGAPRERALAAYLVDRYLTDGD